MVSLSQRNPFFALLLTALGGTLFLSYLVIGREMHFVLYGLLLVAVLFICVFSVKISLALLIFSMLLSPEFVVGATARREITLRLEDILLMVMTIGWLLRMAIFKDIGLMLKNPLNKIIAVYSGIVLLSTLLGIYRGNVNMASGLLFALKLIEYFVLFNVVINYVTTLDDAGFVLNMLLVVFAIISLYGLFQVITGGDVAAPFEGSEGERNTLGGYLVLMCAVAGGILLNGDSAGEKRVLGVVIAIAIVTLVFSISRSGWVSGLVAAFVLFITSKKKNIYLLAVCLALLLLPLLLPDVARERAVYTFQQDFHPGQHVAVGSIWLDTSTSARIFSLQKVMSSFLKHPFLGYGMTGFAFVDGQFIRVLSEFGIIGFSCFMILLYKVHKSIRKAVRTIDNPRFRGMAIGFYAGFWGLMAHALSANTFIIVRISEPFWCLAGLVVVLVLLHGNRSGNKTGEPEPVAAGN